MYVSSQLIDFFEFVLIGAIISCVFDFFRAYRKLNKVTTFKVLSQDIIFFIITTIIIIFSIINLLDSEIRLYIFIGLILGCSIYFCVISRFVIKLYIVFFNMFKEIVSTIFLPVLLNIQVFQKISKKMKKIWKKCCKMFLYMISFKCKFVKNSKNISKLNSNDSDKRGFKFMRNKKELKESSNNKKSKKIRLGHLLMIALVCYFVYTYAQQQIQINKYNSQIEMYSADIKHKKELTEYYNNQKGNTNSDEYIENVARESLGYVKPYEKIFVDANK